MTPSVVKLPWRELLCMNEKVLEALRFAEAMHKGQVDKAGVPYIEHPKAVAAMVDGDEAKIVALLHDTVEDTSATVEEIRSMFGDRVADAVACLTNDKSVPYLEYVARIKGNELARKVKIADLRHNTNLSRIPDVTEADILRIKKKYLPALELLLK